MTPLDRQIDYWDRVAKNKSFTHELDAARFRLLVPETARILDAGCGYGRICDQLYRMGYTDIRGVDVSSEMIERGRRAYPH
ncbi:MAG: class I SAM-dependent methyltransferase, partial [Thermodesulfobacteriota bacterium]